MEIQRKDTCGTFVYLKNGVVLKMRLDDKYFLSMTSQTIDRKALDTKNPRQANTRHDKP